jgi:hypothetical protein
MVNRLCSKIVLALGLGIVAGSALADGAPATKIQRVTAPDPVHSRAFACPPSAPASGTLVGAGRLEITIALADFRTAEKYVHDTPGDPRKLYIDGVDVTDSAQLVETRMVDDGKDNGCVGLRYQLASGDATSTLWNAVFHQGGLFKPFAVPVALGWKSTGPNSSPAMDVPIAVSDAGVVAAGWIALLLLVIGLAWLGAKTNVFRDRAPTWLQLACVFEGAFRTAGTPAAQAVVLQNMFAFAGGTLTYAAANNPDYVVFAKRACDGITATPTPADAEIAAGLLLQMQGPLPRPTWSLSRLQLALWFAFAIGAAIFLALVHWELPALSGSLLTLLGITTGGAGASMLATSDVEASAGSTSKGLFVDILTGFDDKRHVHRYQAVVVNLMLLVAGILSVAQTLQLPTFDATWLGFLTLSGAVNAGGKSMMESGS